MLRSTYVPTTLVPNPRNGAVPGSSPLTEMSVTTSTITTSLHRPAATCAFDERARM